MATSDLVGLVPTAAAISRSWAKLVRVIATLATSG